MKNFCFKTLLCCALWLPLSAAAEGCVAIADLLVWQASQEANSTWATFVKETNAKTIDLDATNIGFDHNLGFRGGFLYEPKTQQPWGNWDTEFLWTYFYTSTTNNFNIGRQIVLPEFFSGFVSGNIFFGADINWRISMNMFDLKFGHTFKPTKSFTIRPAFGIKGGTIYQSINCQWLADIYTSHETVKNDFVGVGPSFTVDTNWNIYKRCGLFANLSTAFMYGRWRINDTYIRPNALGVTATTITTKLDTTQLGTMMFDYILGVEWRYAGRSNFVIQIGYEMQVWINQLRIPTFQQLPVSGDLTLQGGTCRIRIEL